METLTDIIKTVSDCTGIRKWDILEGNSKKAEQARKQVCYLIANGFPHLISTMSDCAGIQSAYILKFSNEIESEIKNDTEFQYSMNVIRKRLGLPPVKKDKRRRRKKISDTKRMFGFDYSESEIEQRHNAIIEANLFMRKYCSYGRKPIDAGMVFTREQRAESSARKWLNQYKN